MRWKHEKKGKVPKRFHFQSVTNNNIKTFDVPKPLLRKHGIFQVGSPRCLCLPLLRARDSSSRGILTSDIRIRIRLLRPYVFAYASEGNNDEPGSAANGWPNSTDEKIGSDRRLFAECLLEFAISTGRSLARRRQGEPFVSVNTALSLSYRCALLYLRAVTFLMSEFFIIPLPLAASIPRA